MAFMYQETHGPEKGVLGYEYWRGRSPGFYYCLLSFSSAVDIWRDQASGHPEGKMQRFTECIAELDLETVDPVQGASPLPLAEEGILVEGTPVDACEQAEQFPVELPWWWLAHRCGVSGASLSFRRTGRPPG